jgi:hypothetical protein
MQEVVDIGLLGCNTNFRAEDGDSLFLRNIGNYLQVYKALKLIELKSVYVTL